jgi:hypothetical protein
MFDRIPKETAETPVQDEKKPSDKVVQPSNKKPAKGGSKRKKRK